LHAAPQYLLVLPGDSWWPFLAAVGTAGFFLLLTVHLVALAWVFGLGAVASVCLWLWPRHHGTDLPRMLRVGSRLVLPVGAAGRASHTWWATMVVVVVDVSIFLSFAFAFVHAAMRLAVCPPPGASLPSGGILALSGALLAASSVFFAWPPRAQPAAQPLAEGDVAGAGETGTGTVAGAGRGWLVLRVVAALACLVAGAGVMGAAYWAEGLDPREDAWSAGIGALLAYHGLHVVTLAVVAAYLAARLMTTQPWRAEWDNTALIWHSAVLQGIAGALLPLLV
jgi:cytochrome c oxidase subunit I+III